jgi:tol-pal system protein YbgF
MNAGIRGLVLLALLLTPVLVGGCVGAFFSQPTNVEVTRSEVESVRREQAEILALVRELKTQMDAQSEATASMRADTNNQLRQLQERLEILQAQLEEQGVSFERFQRQEQVRPAPPVRSETQPPVETSAADTVAATRGGGAAEDARPPGGENELYDAAYRDFTRGNYQLAIAGFGDFLRYYPDSDLADNAQYWIGESRFALGELDAAVQDFLKVRDLYPDGNKVAGATLKIGYAFLRKGDSATARRYFETVIREYPDSDEAKFAQDKLATLR